MDFEATVEEKTDQVVLAGMERLTQQFCGRGSSESRRSHKAQFAVLVERLEKMKYQALSKLSLKSHPELTERWVQDRIAENPQILGLGDVVLKDKERIQPRAGRLDLLLQDTESNHRYEVEVQLGRTDESHIIRTIEYWDIERKRYPQYEHTL